MRNVLTFVAVAFGMAIVSGPAFAAVEDSFSVPEPMSMSLLIGGVVAIAAVRRMRRK